MKYSPFTIVFIFLIIFATFPSLWAEKYTVTPVRMVPGTIVYEKYQFTSTGPSCIMQQEKPVIPRTAGWEYVITETFENYFPGLWSISEDGWGISSSQSYTGDNSVWCAQYNHSDSSHYANSLNTLMTFGPFSLAGTVDADLWVNHWTRIKDENDGFFVLASIDGESFYGSKFTGLLSQGQNDWQFIDYNLTDIPELGDLRGQSQVWIAFGFVSDSVNVSEGCYLDDIILWRNTGANNISLLQPNGGEFWHVGETYDIYWQSSGDIPSGNVNIDYSPDNGVTWYEIAASTPNDGMYSWTIPAVESDQCRVRVSDFDGSPSDLSDNVFTIKYPPEITIGSPNGGEHWQSGVSKQIVWQSKSSSGTVNIFMSQNNGESWSRIFENISDIGNQSWKVPYLSSSECLLAIQDSSNALLADTSDAAFTISSACSLSLNLMPGWNWISCNFIPADSTIASVWDSISGLSIVKGKNGFYIPGSVNSLTNWELGQMYMVHLQTPLRIDLSGSNWTADMPIVLDAGWNWTSYLPRTDMDIENALAGLADNLAIVKTRNGFYIPGLINSIGNVTPGAGLMINLTNADTLIYADTPLQKAINQKLIPYKPVSGNHFAGYLKSDHYQAIVIKDIADDRIKPGSEIGLFTQSGRCIGAGIYTGVLPMAIMAWADDKASQPVDGYKPGDQLIFRIFNPDQGSERSVSYDITTASRLLGESPVMIVRLFGTEVKPAAFGLMQNYPNPFNPETTIKFSIPQPEHVKVSIINIKGELVRTLLDDQQNAGIHTLTWDAINNNGVKAPSGVYFYRLETSARFKVRKMILLK